MKQQKKQTYNYDDIVMILLFSFHFISILFVPSYESVNHIHSVRRTTSLFTESKTHKKCFRFKNHKWKNTIQMKRLMELAPAMKFPLKTQSHTHTNEKCFNEHLKIKSSTVQNHNSNSIRQRQTAAATAAVIIAMENKNETNNNKNQFHRK